VNCVIESKLQELIVSSGQDVDLKKINEDTDLVRDFNFDSINLIQLVVDIENTFNIEINDEDLAIEKISQYRKLVMMLEDKLSE
jgi:acyl carrier protein